MKIKKEHVFIIAFILIGITGIFFLSLNSLLNLSSGSKKGQIIGVVGELNGQVKMSYMGTNAWVPIKSDDVLYNKVSLLSEEESNATYFLMDKSFFSQSESSYLYLDILINDKSTQTDAETPLALDVLNGEVKLSLLDGHSLKTIKLNDTKILVDSNRTDLILENLEEDQKVKISVLKGSVNYVTNKSKEKIRLDAGEMVSISKDYEDRKVLRSKIVKSLEEAIEKERAKGKGSKVVDRQKLTFFGFIGKVVKAILFLD